MCQHFFNNNGKNEWKKYQKYSGGQQQNNMKTTNMSSMNSNLLQTSIVINEMNDMNVIAHRSRNVISSSSINKQPTMNELSSSSSPISVDQNIMSVVPSAPSIGHELFNNENESDIVFLVGPDKNKLWRFPAHSAFLKDVSPYFAAITNDPNNNNNKEIKIDWCDPEIFEIILK